jgi:hypothetical protein
MGVEDKESRDLWKIASAIAAVMTVISIRFCRFFRTILVPRVCQGPWKGVSSGGDDGVNDEEFTTRGLICQ